MNTKGLPQEDDEMLKMAMKYMNTTESENL